MRMRIHQMNSIVALLILLPTFCLTGSQKSATDKEKMDTKSDGHQKTSPEHSLREETSPEHSWWEKTSSEPSWQETTTKPRRQKTSREPSCQETSSESSCQETSSEPTRQETRSEPTWQETTTKSRRQETSSEPSLLETCSEPSLEETTTESNLHDDVLNALPQLITALCVFLVIVNFIVARTMTSAWRDLGYPGPPSFSVLGNRLEIFLKGGLRCSVRHWQQKYGKVFGMYLGLSPVLVVSDIQMVAEILENESRCFNDRSNTPAAVERPPLKTCLFNAKGARWRMKRYNLSFLFAEDNLACMVHCLNLCGWRLADYLAGEARNVEHPIKLNKFATSYVYDALASMLLGLRGDLNTDSNDPFSTVLASVQASSSTEYEGISVPSRINKLSTLLQHAVVERAESKDNRDQLDFLDIMLGRASSCSPCHMVSYPPYDLTLPEVFGNLLFFVLHSQQSLVSSLQFALYLLAQNPEYQESAYQEINRKLGEDDPDYRGLDQLAMMDNLIQETLRLFSPVQEIWRYTQSATTVKGYTIPRNTTILIPVDLVHTNPNNFSNPNAFLPERWRDNCWDQVYLPFGYGPRMCPAPELVLLLLKVALVHIMRRVQLLPPPADDPPAAANVQVKVGLAVTNAGTLRPLTPIELELIPRAFKKQNLTLSDGDGWTTAKNRRRGQSPPRKRAWSPLRSQHVLDWSDDEVFFDLYPNASKVNIAQEFRAVKDKAQRLLDETDGGISPLRCVSRSISPSSSSGSGTYTSPSNTLSISCVTEVEEDSDSPDPVCIKLNHPNPDVGISLKMEEDPSVPTMPRNKRYRVQVSVSHCGLEPIFLELADGQSDTAQGAGSRTSQTSHTSRTSQLPQTPRLGIDMAPYGVQHRAHGRAEYADPEQRQNSPHYQRRFQTEQNAERPLEFTKDNRTLNVLQQLPGLDMRQPSGTGTVVLGDRPSLRRMEERGDFRGSPSSILPATAARVVMETWAPATETPISSDSRFLPRTYESDRVYEPATSSVSHVLPSGLHKQFGEEKPSAAHTDHPKEVSFSAEQNERSGPGPESIPKEKAPPSALHKQLGEEKPSAAHTDHPKEVSFSAEQNERSGPGPESVPKEKAPPRPVDEKPNEDKSPLTLLELSKQAKFKKGATEGAGDKPKEEERPKPAKRGKSPKEKTPKADQKSEKEETPLAGDKNARDDKSKMGGKTGEPPPAGDKKVKDDKSKMGGKTGEPPPAGDKKAKDDKSKMGGKTAEPPPAGDKKAKDDKSKMGGKTAEPPPAGDKKAKDDKSKMGGKTAEPPPAGDKKAKDDKSKMGGKTGKPPPAGDKKAKDDKSKMGGKKVKK